jgi:hypothetical protein
MSVIARLGAVLGLDTKEFVKGVDAAQQKSKEFKQNLKDLEKTTEGLKNGFAAASAAFIGFAGYAINAADEIQDLADANEITTGKILELKSALQLSGGDAGKIDVLFTKFTNAINSAAEGSDTLRDSFKELGVSTNDLGFLTNAELLDKAFVGLSKIEDVTRRNALANELFGKASKSVDFTQMSKNAEKLAGQYKDQEEAIKASADAMEKFEKLFKNVQMAALLAVKPVLDLFNKIPSVNKIEAMTKAFQALGIAIGVAFGVTAVKGVVQLAGALRALTITNPWLLALTAAGGVAAYLFGDKLFSGGEEPSTEAGSQTFPLTEKQRTQKRETPATSKEESFRTAIIKANQEYEKRNVLLKESIANHSEEISLLMQKHTMNADDYSIAERKLNLDQEIRKLEQDKIRELTAAQAEYDALPAKEKNAKLLETNLKNIKDYYDAAIPAQKELNKLVLNQLQTEIDLKNKYIYQDLEVQKIKEREGIELRHSAEMDMLILESQSYKLREKDYNLLKLRIEGAQQLAAIEISYAEKRRDLQIEFERTAKTSKDRELFESKMQNLYELQLFERVSSDAINSQREDNLLKDIERQQSWAAGWNDAFKEYAESAERSSERGRQAFSMVVNNMEAALKNFVETGKLNFKDLIGTIIKQLIVAESVAQATSLFKMGVNSFASLFSSGGASGGGMGSAAGLLFGGKASGGYVDRPTIVGENGAELFVPNTPGTVIPSGSWQQAAASMGNNGFTNNGTYIASMSAIDTQSATQFLASNKNTIWAAYQSANRSVPISR